MTEQRQTGFTVIEVLMFLAISGLMLIGAIAAVSSSINRSRFNDAANSTTSFLQGEYASIASGRNVRSNALGCNSGVINGTASTAGMTNCVVLGRLLEFGVGSSRITSRYIVGRDNAGFTGTDTAAIVNASPIALSDTTTTETFDVPWSTEINRMTSSSISVNYLAIIRSPISERVLFYSFQAGSNLTSISGTLITDANQNRPVDICLLDAGGINSRVGYIRIGTGQGQDVIRTDLTSTAGACA